MRTYPLQQRDSLFWIEIDHGRLADNVRQLKRAAAEAELWAVVKADGYGHGAVETARIALAHGVKGLAVAAVEEGVALREAGIRAPILVLGALPAWQAREYIEYDLIATVADLPGAQALQRAAAAAGRRARAHMKIDTGMGRFGVLPGEALAFASALRSMPSIILEGMYTHFATADEPDSAFAKLQLARFVEVRRELANNGLEPRFVHAAGSAALFALPQARFSMVRVGLALYGLYPSPWIRDLATEKGIRLQPALSLRCQVIAVRRMAAGTPLGYGASFVTPAETTIVTLPIGYSNGVPRQLSNQGYVLIHGRRHPIVGRVCMNHCFADVGDEDVAVGDTATLLGTCGEEEITADEWARRLGTVAYEIVCNVGNNASRRYRGGDAGRTLLRASV